MESKPLTVENVAEWIRSHCVAKGRHWHLGKHKTHCRKGHALIGDNLIINRKRAHLCRICTNEYSKIAMQKGRDKLKNLILLSICFLCVGCTPDSAHKVKVLNADLATGLNKATTTVISLTQQGILSTDEEHIILPKLGDASILSDRINGCTTVPTTLQTCVTPLLTSIRDDVSAATLGVKSAGAQATMNAALSAVVTIINNIAGVK